ncbi:type III secretion system effector protein [Solirubrobacter ginsenosidimutans]|uniref:Type III secretion system effector protein n=1 Tax=Solirubrobacter ginsenosidimutans TaxID=490573 RepID=A0A9X3MRY2_9ACTN|nr:hypothetical protein [Solirubrobacter ginsenosidimutans]MDA0160841.1 type III secretion system effector protein [Solirubrobacter ginsenosidimutans]
MESVRRPRAAHSPMDPQRPRRHAPRADLAVLGLQRSAGNHATAALLQRALKPAFAQQPVWYAPLHQLAQEYNDLRGAKELWGILPKWAMKNPAEARQAALAKLGEVERWVYGWFRQRENQDRTADPEWAPMRAFLNQLQTERDGLVALALSDGGDPPLANFAQLQGGEQQQVREIWNELIREKSGDIDLRMGLAVDGADKAARIRLLADFSRLLETETGRMVVGGLSGEQPRLTVTPAKGAKFVASPVNEAYEGLTVGAPPKATEQFVSLVLDGLSVQQRKVAINDARVRNPDARGVSLTTAADGTLHFRFNTGTGSNVTVPSGAQDTSDQGSSLALGTNDFAIIAPTFVSLGHELGHALRSLHGITAKDDEATDAMLAHAFKNVVVGDRKEEFFNIDVIENRIRAEAGLSLRGAHADWSGTELARMFDVAQAINLAATNAHQLASAQLGQEIAQLRIAADALTDGLRDALERRRKRKMPPSVDEILALRLSAATMRQQATNLEQRATVIGQQQQNVVALKPLPQRL